jgi:glycosyltransferase involved in cell wall biosynthesis
MKIAIVTSSPITINVFLHDLIFQLSASHHVTVITNVRSESELAISGDNIFIHPVKIYRKISYWYDLKALSVLLRLFKKNNFDLVYSVTPKAGFLAMLATFLTGVRCRVHIFTGQVWVTKVGKRRSFLKNIDKLIARFATHLLADSTSQMQFLIDKKIVDERKIKVLGNGSISGVNLKQFSSDMAMRSYVRFDLNIDENDIVFLFLGRLDPDKGITVLVDAFELLISKFDNVKLIIAGPDEANIRETIFRKAEGYFNFIRHVGITSNPEHYMNAADVLCLPSYREGFGTVVIEAAAVGIPAIGSNIYGIRDAIVDNVTGLLFPVRNVEALFEAMQIMVLDEKVRKQFGHSAKQRAVDQFSQEFVTASFVHYFEEIFNVGRAK